MVSDATVATVVALVVTASFPFYLYGAWIVLDEEVVTWSVLTYHLKFIAVGLLLTAIPVLTWMLPRAFEKPDGYTALHAFLGLQAYAMLLFAMTGIARIFQVKHRHDLYDAPDQDVDIDDLHENVGAWRSRLRIGVLGYVGFWLLAWLVGMVRYVIDYVLH